MEKVYYIYGKSFEWDLDKSIQNLKKHGVSIEQSIAIWTNDYLELEGLARKTGGESRSATLGKIGEQIYVAIWTKRQRRIRIISVRRARYGEKEIYYKKIL